MQRLTTDAKFPACARGMGSSVYFTATPRSPIKQRQQDSTLLEASPSSRLVMELTDDPHRNSLVDGLGGVLASASVPEARHS
ncbi:hypothetical protein CHU98_g4679 [Xylaria longipes]|nr:hypothetical protein CHU98_g4679 [Xylaria longipes]